MRSRIAWGLVWVAALGVLLGGCSWFAEPTAVTSKSALPGDNYILSFQKLPKSVEAKIAAAGGTVRAVLGEIDAVLVTAESADFLTAVKGITGLDVVIPDATMNWLPDLQKVEFVVEPEHIGSDEPFYARYQWDMKAIDAPGAWNAGYTGEGVRVAVLDTGVDVNHPDLVPNINFELSKSYVPEEPYIDDMHGHGSNVAGIIAAADNGVGVIGVAPNAEIVALKVLSGAGSGDFGWMLEAILYAVECDVDIVNMSLGAYMDKGGFYDEDGTWVAANEVAGFLNLVKKTVNYATQQGVLIIASAGNDAQNGQGDSGLLHVPSDVGETVCVSATGPFGWGTSTSVYLDDFAVYSNYGLQVDFAAPGGNYDPTLPGYWYDFVLNCTNGQWYAWYAGTSQASPHVAGVAALIVEANGGDVKPSQILQALRHSADDLGKPGQDVYFGYGRVNAAAAVAP
ncbi:MAG: S8 family serine peptidase [Candidatus Bipolaricaulota bacterium]|nr:S8 family serine peptidase [Candidatus Bipolaricaulota bacterium]